MSPVSPDLEGRSTNVPTRSVDRTPTTPVICVEDLRVRYDSVDVVDGVSFDVHPGEVIALLGPNGAGKTTTVEVLEGHRRRTGGSVDVLGFDPEAGDRHFRERIGIVLQDAGLDAELTVRDAIAFFADLYPRARPVDEMIHLVHLESKRRSRVRTLSGGQRRRLDLAIALVGRPDLLFLDEPTTGLDPSARRQAWTLLDEVRTAGTTIVMTTHYMDEVERLADRVVLMMSGRVVATETPATIGNRNRSAAEIRFQLPDARSAADLPRLIRPLCEVDGCEVLVRSNRPTWAMSVLSSWAVERGDELASLTVQRPTLEEIMLELTTPAGGGAS